MNLVLGSPSWTIVGIWASNSSYRQWLYLPGSIRWYIKVGDEGSVSKFPWMLYSWLGRLDYTGWLISGILRESSCGFTVLSWNEIKGMVL